MTTQEYIQLEKLFNKLSVELKAPICIAPSMHDGWLIARYAQNGNGDIIDSEVGYSIDDVASKLLAKDVTKKLIPHDIIS